MRHAYAPDGSIATHDDRCPWTQIHGKDLPAPDPWDPSWTWLCCCEAIDSVYADALRDAVEAVKAMNGWEESGSDYPPFTAVDRDDAVAAIEALGGES